MQRTMLRVLGVAIALCPAAASAQSSSRIDTRRPYQRTAPSLVRSIGQVVSHLGKTNQIASRVSRLDVHLHPVFSGAKMMLALDPAGGCDR